jgi:hypothetical protein
MSSGSRKPPGIRVSNIDGISDEPAGTNQACRLQRSQRVPRPLDQRMPKTDFLISCDHCLPLHNDKKPPVVQMNREWLRCRSLLFKSEGVAKKLTHLFGQHWPSKDFFATALRET